MVTKEISKWAGKKGGQDTMLTVRVFKPASERETQSKDPAMVEEFLVGQAYAMQVVLTNVSPNLPYPDTSCARQTKNRWAQVGSLPPNKVNAESGK